MRQRDPLLSYRLRQLVLQLERFTVGELSTISGVERERVEQFIFKLSRDIPGVFRSERLPASGVGKPPSRYFLSEDGATTLSARNLKEGRALRTLLSEAPQAEAVRETASVISDIAVPEVNVGSWINSFQPSFTEALKQGAVLIVRPSEPVSAQVGRTLTPLTERITFTIADVLQALKSILTPWQQMRLERQGWTAGSYALAGQAPVQLQVEMEGGKPAIKISHLSTHVPTPNDLRLPNLAEGLALRGHGLVLVTGIARSGRSTTMAALVNSINTTRQAHIATIEEPAHYFYPPGQSFLEQKQVAVDVPDFESALRLVLSNGADVIVLSDFNNPQTFSAALEASQRGLIFGRVFAASPGEAIGQIVNKFPGPEQARIRERLAQNLTGIISVKALPEKSGGTVVAAEVLEWRSDLSDLILEPEQTPQISEAVTTRNAGTSFQQTVDKLYEEQIISADTAARFVSSKSA